MRMNWRWRLTLQGLGAWGFGVRALVDPTGAEVLPGGWLFTLAPCWKYALNMRTFQRELHRTAALRALRNVLRPLPSGKPLGRAAQGPRRAARTRANAASAGTFQSGSSSETAARAAASASINAPRSCRVAAKLIQAGAL